MQAIWNGAVIAKSNDTVVVEGNHYFPRSSVNSTYLVTSDTTSDCPWKGTANYYNLCVAGEINRDAAWYYVEPKDAAREIANHLAFWQGVEVTVD